MPNKLYKTDRITSRRMSAVRPSDTGPELVVRRLIFSMGFRYRINRFDIPGRADIAFPSRHRVIFVHGCFWHRHKGCPKASTPTRNAKLWREKFAMTVIRDKKNILLLRKAAWKTLTIWECSIKKKAWLKKRLRAFLGDSRDSE